MAIAVQCPSCGVSSHAADSLSGRSVRCKKCGNPFVAPPTLDGSRSDTRKRQPAGMGGPFPTLPAEFGRYRVLRPLGLGGMGAVYLATDSELRREVALKIPFFDATESPQPVERFVREAQSAAALHHPHICTVYDAGRIAGTPFLTMGFVKGTPLDRAIDPVAPMPQPRAAEIARKVALGLAHAHGKGIVHRDLKPANVVLTEDGEPVVMDFGLAKRGAGVDPNEAKRSRDGGAAAPNDPRLTRDGSVLGTPSYMSPEQVRGDADVGPASDVYSLGVLLFEMLTGRTPYSGNMGAVMGQILAAPVPPLAETRSDADPRLDAICQRAMAKFPAARFGSMAEMAAALGEYLSATANPAVSVELVEPAAPPIVVVPAPAYRPAPTVAPFDELTEPTPKKRKKAAPKATAYRLVPAALIGVAVLLVGLLAAWAGGAFKVKTKEGTIELTGVPADAEVFVDGEKVTVTWDQGKQSAEVRVKPGTHKVEVKKDGFTAFGKDVTLEDKGRKVLTARLEPKEPAKKDPVVVAPPAADPARKGAEYVLSVGGTVRIDDGIRIQNAADLPPDSFTLTGIFLSDNDRVSDAGLAAFEGVDSTRLTHLDLWNAPRLSNRALQYFKDCKALNVLKLRNTQITDKGLARFKDCKDLAELWLSGTPVGDPGLSAFDGLKSLTTLDLEGTQVTDKGLAYFKDCKNLTFIILRNTQVGDAGVFHFKDCKKLKDLWARDTRLTEQGLGVFTDCRELERIELVGTKVTAAGVADFKKSLPNCRVEWDAPQTTEPPPMAVAPKEAGFVPLFNGKDLLGWKTHTSQPGEWRVKDGVLIGSGPTTSQSL